MQRKEILKYETINSESMCILLKAKWRNNRDKHPVKFILSFSGVILKNDSHVRLFNAEKSLLAEMKARR